MKKIKVITILGRRWFEKTNGNTYHSVTVFVDGEEVGRIPFEYGYGSMYFQNAMKLLEEKGVIKLKREKYMITYPDSPPQIQERISERCTQYCARKKIKIIDTTKYAMLF